MSLAIVHSRAASDLNAPPVTVEVHLSRGLPRFNMVGLPEAAVKESRDRVRSTIMTAHYEFPHEVITVNLAPADLPKEGGRFDLPIAIGILAASRQLPMTQLNDYEFVGELALSGELRAVRGVLPMVLAAKQSGRQLVIPAVNVKEASLVTGSTVMYARHLQDVCAHLRGNLVLPFCEQTNIVHLEQPLDLADVKGQAHAKRALEIAAAGRHSLLMVGPPGTGKTMLASRLPSLLPTLTEQQALEAAAIASMSSQGFDVNQWMQIPFRAPHHSSSSVALVGGGRPPKPGEITLAHHGVLFLDELPEFSRHVLECLREPLESGVVTISRAAHQVAYPARFQLIAAMNPCPCGYAGSLDDECQCSYEQIKRYRHKLSGPLLDRIDMQVEVAKMPAAFLKKSANQQQFPSYVIRERVIKAQARQWQRQGHYNAQLAGQALEDVTALTDEAETYLQMVMTKLNFSARLYHRLIRVARTIADLAESSMVAKPHVAEALQYRCLDKSRLK